MAGTIMRLPQFTTMQLLLLTTLAALLAGLFTTAWRMRADLILSLDFAPLVVIKYTPRPISKEYLYYVKDAPGILALISARLLQIALFISSFASWSAAWGIVRKRGRESLAKNSVRQLENDARRGLPTPFASPTSSAPLAVTVCWGLMVIGGIVALGIPIVLMFTLGPLLFPTIYFSLFVGLAAIARGAARDSVGLKRTAGLQLANMIALDPANVVFAAMEFALLRGRSGREYLGAENR